MAGAGAPLWDLGASGFPWNVRAGRLSVKLSTSESKSKFGLELAVGRALVGVGRGLVTTGVGDGCGAGEPSAILNKFCRALPPWVGLGAAAVGLARGLCCLAGCCSAWKLENWLAGCGRRCAGLCAGLLCG